jgi:hypothetical protein
MFVFPGWDIGTQTEDEKCKQKSNDFGDKVTDVRIILKHVQKKQCEDMDTCSRM